MLKSGIVGEITSVHFEWLLDTRHGADYFRRWHREKRNSGGLLVHKSTHHFDLMNFWLASYPERVYAEGAAKTVWMDMGTGKSAPIPDVVRALFAPPAA